MRRAAGGVAAATIVCGIALLFGSYAVASAACQAPPGQSGTPYLDMPAIAPIGVRVDRYLLVPAKETLAAIDPAKGYRLQQLGRSCPAGTSTCPFRLYAGWKGDR